MLARRVHELLIDPVHGRTERSFELRAFRSNKYRTKLGETTVNKRWRKRMPRKEK